VPGCAPAPPPARAVKRPLTCTFAPLYALYLAPRCLPLYPPVERCGDSAGSAQELRTADAARLPRFCQPPLCAMQDSPVCRDYLKVSAPAESAAPRQPASVQLGAEAAWWHREPASERTAATATTTRTGCLPTWCVRLTAPPRPWPVAAAAWRAGFPQSAHVSAASRWLLARSPRNPCAATTRTDAASGRGAARRTHRPGPAEPLAADPEGSCWRLFAAPPPRPSPAAVRARSRGGGRTDAAPAASAAASTTGRPWS